MSEPESVSVISDEKKNRPKRRRFREKVDEKALETIVFGRESNVLENITKRLKPEEESEESFGIIEDRNASKELPLLSHFEDNDDSDESDSSEDINYTKSDFFPELKPLREEFPEEEREEHKKKTVWSDADDDIGVRDALDSRVLPKRVAKDDSYKHYLENRFTDLYKNPKWAQIDRKQRQKDSDDSDDSEDDVERTAKNFKLKTNDLKKGILPIKKCTDLTKDHKIKVSIIW